MTGTGISGPGFATALDKAEGAAGPVAKAKQNGNGTGLGKKDPSRVAVGGVVRLWFHKVKFQWVELGLGLLRV